MHRSLWSRLRTPKDPYEDFYLHATAEDPRNLIVNRIRQAPDGSVFAVKAETHTPEVMSSHVKELGRFFGADLVHIAPVRLLQLAGSPDEDGPPDLPFAVFLLFKAKHDPRDAPGIGGHAVTLKGAFATFQLSAIIREFGFNARRLPAIDSDAAASRAGLGALERGRLNSTRFGPKVHVADVILTDLPVTPD